MNYQRKVLDEISDHCRFMEYSMDANVGSADTARYLSAISKLDQCVVGLSHNVVDKIGGSVPGLKAFPALDSAHVGIPGTQNDLFISIHGSDPGIISNRSRVIEGFIDALFIRRKLTDGFKFDGGRDLTGYEDGTENPKGEDAVGTAIVHGQGRGLDGGTFLAVQQWRHDFTAFDALPPDRQDDLIGRRKQSNEEFDAPPSAHVKRTAQEDFDPEAFLVRRSMPWSDNTGSGLMFIAFGKSFYAFEAQMKKMMGMEDGIVDGLFKISAPVSGSYYWCPPVKQNGSLDLSALGIG